MKRERWILCLIGGILAFLLSLGTVQCVVTAFSLEVERPTLLVVACLLFSVGSALCLQLKYGSVTALCLAAMGMVLLVGRETLVEQCFALVYRISVLYDNAYDWGIVPMGLDSWDHPSDRPLQLLAYFTAMSVSFVVCRRKAVWLALLPTVVPLLLCLVVTDTVPADGWLYLVILGLIVLIMTSSLRRKAVGQSNTLTVMVAAGAALVLGILFLTNPRNSYVNRTEEIQDTILEWVGSLPKSVEELQNQLSAGTASERTETENLSTVGVRYRQTYPVMDVTAAVTGPLYLRGQDFDVYTGTSWSSTRNRSEALPDSSVLAPAGTVKISTRRTREVLYLPYYPQQRLILVEGSINNMDEQQNYSFPQKILPAQWRQQVTGEGTPVGGRNSAYLTLPQATAAWAEAMALRITENAVTATEKADAIADYVRGSAVYDLETAAMPSTEADFAQWFLEQSDTGYCVHFATAAAVLLRGAGVEARYVTGYLASGTAERSVTVTAAQAHAWAEYYEPSLGVWIPLEATPGRTEDAAGESEQVTAGTTETTEMTTEVPTEVMTEGIETTEGTAPASTQESAGELPELPEQKRETPGWLKTLLGVLLGAAVAAAALQGQLMIRLELRRRWYSRRGTNGRALLKWREVVCCARLLKQKPPKEPEMLAQKAKFSQHTLTQEELNVFDRQLAAYRRSLREKPWYLRLLFRYVFAME